MLKVLFMIPNLGHGGAEKVLVNLVNHMDPTKFDITVMALYDEGVNRQFLRKEIKYKSCLKRSFPGIAHVLKFFTPKQLYNHFITEEYDIVISYLEGQTARIISGCDIPKTKKVCWIHRTYISKKDAARLFRSQREAEQCYSSFNKIVSVSEDVQTAFMALFLLNDKGIVLHNTNQSDYILKASENPVPDNLFQKDEIKLCAMGSLIPVKGFERLISIHRQLIEEGYPVHTYILGEGSEKEKLMLQIAKSKVSDSVTLLGYQKNPYCYMRHCDLFVCSSYSEGFSTAVTEALLLGIPVVTTKVSGMNELLGENNEYGVITQNNEEMLLNGIKFLIDNQDLLLHYRQKASMRGKDFATRNTVKAVEVVLSEM